MATASYRYRVEVLTALAAHGVRPTATTAPQFVRTVLRDLYNYELRRLRDTVRRRALPRQALAGEVVQLRRRYWLLSVPPDEWLASPEPS